MSGSVNVMRRATGDGAGAVAGSTQRLSLRQGARTGEERGRMPVGPHPEPDQVEPRRTRGAGSDLEGATDFGLVLRSCQVGIRCIGRHAVHRGWPDSREMVEQQRARQPEVGIGMVGRDGTLVAPEEFDARPVDSLDPRQGRQQRADDARSRAAGEGQHEPTTAPDRIAGGLHDAVGGGLRQRSRIGQDR